MPLWVAFPAANSSMTRQAMPFLAALSRLSTTAASPRFGHRCLIATHRDNSFDGVNYQAVFEAPAHIWTQLSLPLTDFQPSFRGRRVPGAPPFDPARLQQIGLMIADRQAGPFALAIRSIGFE